MNKTIFSAALGTLLSLAAFSAQAEVTGDVKAGETKAAMCIGCHGIPGYQNSFPEIHRVPMISGQNGPYIVAALTAYKAGERKHPSMRGIAGSLTEQDMSDLAAFYSQHSTKPALGDKPSKEPSAAVAALLEKGGCVACHGDNFSKAIDPSYPKLSGQHKDYLYVALKAYKQGSKYIGRENAIMAGQVEQFSLSELKQIANYLGSLPTELETKPQSRFR